VNKVLPLFLFLFLITSCSLDQKSGIWTKPDKIEKDKDLVIVELFKEEKKLDNELNPNVRIQLKSQLSKNNFSNDLSNNNGRVNYDGNLKTISKYKFSKIDNFNKFEPEIVFDQNNLFFFDNKGSILKFDKFSKLAEPLLDHATKYYASPASVDKAILDLVKKRLLKTKRRLICARCGKWQLAVITEEVKKNLHCKYCKSRQITNTFYTDYDLVKIIQKKYNGKKLSAEENKSFKRAWTVASLIETFGKNASIVLAGHGIGADTAKRILRNMTDPELMYKQIYEAERQYVMTRPFWDDN